MRLSAKISLVLAVAIILSFFIVKTLVVFAVIETTKTTHLFEYACVWLFIPPFVVFVRGFISKTNSIHQAVVDQLQDKNTYLEHAAKILRHDMHSGINVYIPRGIGALERRIPREVFEQYKLDIPLKLLKDGLLHTQKVYKGVFEFTNLVKQGNRLEMTDCDLREVLTNYLQTTAYKDQVIMDWLPRVRINEALFCTAVDNLIRNGLKYNDSENKVVAIYGVDDRTIAIQDNGRGMTQEEFDVFSRTNTRRQNQKEKGSGLGLGICIAILREHGFNVTCEVPAEGGTRIKIDIGNSIDAAKAN